MFASRSVETIKDVSYPDEIHSFLGAPTENSPIIGNTLSHRRMSWLARGNNLVFVENVNSSIVAYIDFSDFLQDSCTITCGVEVPYPDVNDPLLLLGCTTALGGMLVVYHPSRRRAYRAIDLDIEITCLCIIDCNSDKSTILPKRLNWMRGVIAAGGIDGSIILIDMCKDLIDNAINGQFVSGEINWVWPKSTSRVQYINYNDNEHAILCKMSRCHKNNESICFVLNDVEGEVQAPQQNGNNSPVSCLHYNHSTASLFAGFEVGVWHMYSITSLSPMFVSSLEVGSGVSVVSMSCLEPSDDPRATVYLWVGHSSLPRRPSPVLSPIQSPSRSPIRRRQPSMSDDPPFSIMYALMFQEKTFIPSYGVYYSNFLQCAIAHELDMTKEFPNFICGKLISVNSLTASFSHKYLCKERGEGSEELHLWSIVWQCGEDNLNTYLTLFDLNQWYKEQMPNEPRRILEESTTNLPLKDTAYFSTILLPNPSGQALISVSVDSSSVTAFRALYPIDAHYYPSAVSFRCMSLGSEGVTYQSVIGVQEWAKKVLNNNCPLAMSQPNQAVRALLSAALLPVFDDLNSTFTSSMSSDACRSFLVTVCVENGLSNAIIDCALQWYETMGSDDSCSLGFIVNALWDILVLYKNKFDFLCVPLFDHSGMELDFKSRSTIKFCFQIMKQVCDIYLKLQRDFSVGNNICDIEYKLEAIQLIILYANLVQWCLSMRLLPEKNTMGLPEMAIPYHFDLLKTDTAHRRKSSTLMIDAVVKHLFPDAVAEWGRQYPPSSMQSLLRIVLAPAVEVRVKHLVFHYFLLDIIHIIPHEKYSDLIEELLKYHYYFNLSEGASRIIQAYWDIDRQNFRDAVDGLLDLTVKKTDLAEWEHRLIIDILIKNKQYSIAFKYLKGKNPVLRLTSDLKIEITLTIAVGNVANALFLTRQQPNIRGELRNHFFTECIKFNEMKALYHLPLDHEEEESLLKFLGSSKGLNSQDCILYFYISRRRYTEAFALYDKMRMSGLCGNDAKSKDRDLIIKGLKDSIGPIAVFDRYIWDAQHSKPPAEIIENWKPTSAYLKSDSSNVKKPALNSAKEFTAIAFWQAQHLNEKSKLLNLPKSREGDILSTTVVPEVETASMRAAAKRKFEVEPLFDVQTPSKRAREMEIIAESKMAVPTTPVHRLDYSILQELVSTPKVIQKMTPSTVTPPSRPASILKSRSARKEELNEEAVSDSTPKKISFSLPMKNVQVVSTSKKKLFMVENVKKQSSHISDLPDEVPSTLPVDESILESSSSDYDLEINKGPATPENLGEISPSDEEADVIMYSPVSSNVSVTEEEDSEVKPYSAPAAIETVDEKQEITVESASIAYDTDKDIPNVYDTVTDQIKQIDENIVSDTFKDEDKSMSEIVVEESSINFIPEENASVSENPTETIIITNVTSLADESSHESQDLLVDQKVTVDTDHNVPAASLAEKSVMHIEDSEVLHVESSPFPDSPQVMIKEATSSVYLPEEGKADDISLDEVVTKSNTLKDSSESGKESAYDGLYDDLDAVSSVGDEYDADDDFDKDNVGNKSESSRDRTTDIKYNTPKTSTIPEQVNPAESDDDVVCLDSDSEIANSSTQSPEYSDENSPNQDDSYGEPFSDDSSDSAETLGSFEPDSPSSSSLLEEPQQQVNQEANVNNHESINSSTAVDNKNSHESSIAEDSSVNVSHDRNDTIDTTSEKVSSHLEKSDEPEEELITSGDDIEKCSNDSINVEIDSEEDQCQLSMEIQKEVGTRKQNVTIVEVMGEFTDSEDEMTGVTEEPDDEDADQSADISMAPENVEIVEIEPDSDMDSFNVTNNIAQFGADDIVCQVIGDGVTSEAAEDYDKKSICSMSEGEADNIPKDESFISQSEVSTEYKDVESENVSFSDDAGLETKSFVESCQAEEPMSPEKTISSTPICRDLEESLSTTKSTQQSKIVQSSHPTEVQPQNSPTPSNMQYLDKGSSAHVSSSDFSMTEVENVEGDSILDVPSSDSLATEKSQGFVGDVTSSDSPNSDKIENVETEMTVNVPSSEPPIDKSHDLDTESVEDVPSPNTGELQDSEAECVIDVPPTSDKSLDLDTGSVEDAPSDSPKTGELQDSEAECVIDVPPTPDKSLDLDTGSVEDAPSDSPKAVDWHDSEAECVIDVPPTSDKSQDLDTGSREDAPSDSLKTGELQNSEAECDTLSDLNQEEFIIPVCEDADITAEEISDSPEKKEVWPCTPEKTSSQTEDPIFKQYTGIKDEENASTSEADKSASEKKYSKREARSYEEVSSVDDTNPTVIFKEKSSIFKSFHSGYELPKIDEEDDDSSSIDPLDTALIIDEDSNSQNSSKYDNRSTKQDIDSSEIVMSEEDVMEIAFVDSSLDDDSNSNSELLLETAFVEDKSVDIQKSKSHNVSERSLQYRNDLVDRLLSSSSKTKSNRHDILDITVGVVSETSQIKEKHSKHKVPMVDKCVMTDKSYLLRKSKKLLKKETERAKSRRKLETGEKPRSPELQEEILVNYETPKKVATKKISGSPHEGHIILTRSASKKSQYKEKSLDEVKKPNKPELVDKSVLTEDGGLDKTVIFHSRKSRAQSLQPESSSTVSKLASRGLSSRVRSHDDLSKQVESEAHDLRSSSRATVKRSQESENDLSKQAESEVHDLRSRATMKRSQEEESENFPQERVVKKAFRRKHFEKSLSSRLSEQSSLSSRLEDDSHRSAFTRVQRRKSISSTDLTESLNFGSKAPSSLPSLSPKSSKESDYESSSLRLRKESRKSRMPRFSNLEEIKEIPEMESSNIEETGEKAQKASVSTRPSVSRTFRIARRRGASALREARGRDMESEESRGPPELEEPVPLPKKRSRRRTTSSSSEPPSLELEGDMDVKGELGRKARASSLCPEIKPKLTESLRKSRPRRHSQSLQEDAEVANLISNPLLQTPPKASEDEQASLLTEYSGNRRLTRHQKTLIERSITETPSPGPSHTPKRGRRMARSMTPELTPTRSSQRLLNKRLEGKN